MGLNYRKRISLGPGMWANVSKSGVSVSKKVSKVTVNSRGRLFVALAKGLSYRGKV